MLSDECWLGQKQAIQRSSSTVLWRAFHESISQEAFSGHKQQTRESDRQIRKLDGQIRKSLGRIRKFDGHIRKSDSRILEIEAPPAASGCFVKQWIDEHCKFDFEDAREPH